MHLIYACMHLINFYFPSWAYEALETLRLLYFYLFAAPLHHLFQGTSSRFLYLHTSISSFFLHAQYILSILLAGETPIIHTALVRWPPSHGEGLNQLILLGLPSPAAAAAAAAAAASTTCSHLPLQLPLSVYLSVDHQSIYLSIFVHTHRSSYSLNLAL